MGLLTVPFHQDVFSPFLVLSHNLVDAENVANKFDERADV
jgi:hypothetical protein